MLVASSAAMREASDCGAHGVRTKQIAEVVHRLAAGSYATRAASVSL